MKVAIDTSPLTSGHKGRGVGAYTHSLVQTLKNTHSDLTFVFSPNPRSTGADLIHYPYFDLFFHSLPISKPAKTIVTIHDVIPLIYPRKYPSGLKGRLKLTLQRVSLASVSAIITDSNSSAKDIVKYLKVDPAKVHLVSLAAPNEFKRSSQKQINLFKQKHSLPDFFISYVGDINYNKNLPSLIKAVSSVDQAHLVLVTRANIYQHHTEAQAQMAASSIRRALKRLKDKTKVKILKLDSQAELATLYSASNWYIQPSLYEGFGFPILEAFSCKTPVICSDASSLPEVAGKAAIYFNPTSPTNIATAIKKALSLSNSLRQQLITKGTQQAKKFSWKTTAIKTIKIYKSVLNP